MADRPLTDFDRQCIQAFQTWDAMGRPDDPRRAAKALGIPRHTFSNRLLKFYMRDLGAALPFAIQPGHEVVGDTVRLDSSGNVRGRTVKTARASGDLFDMPDGHEVKGVSAFLDGSGNVTGQWVKTDRKRPSPEAYAEAAKIAAETYAGPAAPLKYAFEPRGSRDRRFLNAHLLPDLHIGQHSSGQVAQRDWSLDTAISTYKDAFRALFEQAPSAGTGLIVGGGDLLHADDDTRLTRASGNLLDVAEPYEVVLSATENLMVFKVELALQVYPSVVVRIMKGNHDPDSAIAIAHYLAAWFRHEPRVQVILDARIYFPYLFGKVLLGFTHGHALKIDKLPGVLSHDHRELWGKATRVYCHGFHIHHRSKNAGVTDGTPWETHEAPTPRDTFHEEAGYRGPQSFPVISYHQELGEKRRITESVH